ncbi:MAG: nitroreductase family protein [Caldisericota bacterium]|nr:nitroreductase family protein [Caldisericota bacterium]
MYENEKVLNGKELLMKRRSVREFKDKEVLQDVLREIFELSRFAPTASNSQAYYFVVVTDKKALEELANVRGGSTAPIGRAPMAVAICVDPDKTSRPTEDGCIAAYHFMLAARYYSLGTCWMADMDRENIKQALNIPQNHLVATVTPVGYPVKEPDMPTRKPKEEFIKYSG